MSHRPDTRASVIPAASGGATSDGDELQTLKKLLLGEEKAELERLREHVEDPGLRAGDVAEVLPDAIRRADAEGDGELTEALEAPVTECIESAIQRNPDSFANALYPVMGPAIRQSIANTLKGLIENINRTLEHSLSIQGLKWRLEAMRTGTPFAEVVLRHTLAYRVEQVFLIEPRSGLLMQHVADELAVGGDADAISGMLTAITRFVQDAFAAERDDELESVEVGDHTVLLVHGPRAYLAAVVRGLPPPDLRERCQQVLEQLHAHHRTLLEGFDGNAEALAPLRHRLERCLISAQRERPARRGLSPALILLLLALAGLLAWWGWGRWQAWQAARDLEARQQRLVERLEQTPGITLTEVRPGPVLHLRGLRDPLAPPVKPLLQASGLAPEQVRLALRPYIDLSPRLVLERAQRKLHPPPEITLALDDGTLRLSGYADDDWIARARMLAPLLPGIQAVDASGLVPYDDYLLQQVRERLEPPPSVQLAVNDRHLSLAGSAPLDWIAALPQRLDSIEGLAGVDSSGLQPEEAAEYDSLRARIDGRAIYFDADTKIVARQKDALDALAQDILRLAALGRRLQRPFQVRITGRTDGIGSMEYNRRLARQRALTVRDRLVALGVPSELLVWEARLESQPVMDPQLRRAELHIVPPQD